MADNTKSFITIEADQSDVQFLLNCLEMAEDHYTDDMVETSSRLYAALLTCVPFK